MFYAILCQGPSVKSSLYLLLGIAIKCCFNW